MDNGVLLNIGRPIKFNNKVQTTPTDAKIQSTQKNNIDLQKGLRKVITNVNWNKHQ